MSKISSYCVPGPKTESKVNRGSSSLFYKITSLFYGKSIISLPFLLANCSVSSKFKGRKRAATLIVLVGVFSVKLRMLYAALTELCRLLRFFTGYRIVSELKRMCLGSSYILAPLV